MSNKDWTSFALINFDCKSHSGAPAGRLKGGTSLTGCGMFYELGWLNQTDLFNIRSTESISVHARKSRRGRIYSNSNVCLLIQPTNHVTQESLKSSKDVLQIPPQTNPQRTPRWSKRRFSSSSLTLRWASEICSDDDGDDDDGDDDDRDNDDDIYVNDLTI